jgi:hypothetical protein
VRCKYCGNPVSKDEGSPMWRHETGRLSCEHSLFLAKPATSAADIIRLALGDHTQSARNKRCGCGWRPTWPDGRIGAEYIQHNDHLAEEIAKDLVEAGMIPGESGLEQLQEAADLFTKPTDEG